MTPIQAFLLLALGAGYVYFLTRRPIGLGADGYDNPTAPGGFTQEQLDYYFGGFTTHLTNTQAAALGAQAGAPVAGVTFGISIAVGALAGWLAARNSNDTREDREVFARRLGFMGQNSLGVHTDITAGFDDKSKGLYSYLTFTGHEELTLFAMHEIGRKDFDRNIQWMVDVLAALWRAGFPFPK